MTGPWVSRCLCTSPDRRRQIAIIIRLIRHNDHIDTSKRTEKRTYGNFIPYQLSILICILTLRSQKITYRHLFLIPDTFSFETTEKGQPLYIKILWPRRSHGRNPLRYRAYSRANAPWVSLLRKAGGRVRKPCRAAMMNSATEDGSISVRMVLLNCPWPR